MNRTMLVLLVAACSEAPIEPIPTGDDATAVAFGHDTFVMLRNRPTPTSARGELSIETSQDGITWTERLHRQDIAAHEGAIAVSANGFLAVVSEYTDAGPRSVSFISADGLSWTGAADPPPETTGVVAFADRFIAVSGAAGIVTTVDGSAWSSPVAGTAEKWFSPRIVAAGGRAIAYGEGQLLLESADGETWASLDTQLTVVATIGQLRDTAVGYGYFDCCFGERPDGITHTELRRGGVWTRTVRDTRGPIAFVDLGDHAVAADFEHVLTSVDGGTTWQPVADLGAPSRLATMASDGAGTVVLAAYEEWTSHDGGLTWTSPASRARE